MVTKPAKGAPGSRRAVTMLVALFVLLEGANLFFTSSQVSTLRAAVLASCAFAADLGSAPVAPSPAVKPSKLGVTIVADSRQQWRKLGCPGQLAPPAPSFAKWARYYHLPDT